MIIRNDLVDIIEKSQELGIPLRVKNFTHTDL